MAWILPNWGESFKSSTKVWHNTFLLTPGQPDVFKEYSQDVEEISINVDELDTLTLKELQKYVNGQS